MKRIIYVCFLVLIISKSFGLDKSKKVTISKLKNGLTYCVNEEPSDTGKLSIKFAVRFNSNWVTERERILSTLVEKLIVSSLEETVTLIPKNDEQVMQLEMHEPQLFAVPNLLLFKLDLHHPNQEFFNHTISFLSHSLEDLSSLEDQNIEYRVGKILQDYRDRGNHSLKPRQPFYEDDPFFPGLNLDAYDDIYPEITVEEIRLFYKEHYKPENMALFVSGNLTNLAVNNVIEYYFSSFIAGNQEEDNKFQVGNFEARRCEYLFFTSSDFNKISSKLCLNVNPGYDWVYCSSHQTANKEFKKLAITKKEKETITEIVHSLASTSVPKLLWKKRRLEKMGKKIEQVHPLRFIHHIVSSEAGKKELQLISKNFFKWSGFLDGFKRRMNEEYYKENLEIYLQGFCEDLSLEKHVFEKLIKNKDWEGFVKALL